MQITFIGIVAIMLTIFAIIRKNENMLLEIAMFFSVFGASIAINIEATTTPIWPYEIPTIFWIILQLYNIISGKEKINIKDDIIHNKIIIGIIIFTLMMIFGEIWMFLSKTNIPYYDYKFHENRVITFTSKNITQPIRALFFIVFAFFIALKKFSKTEIIKIIRAFEYGCIFAVGWAFVQYLLNLFNIEYPVYIFNNNPYVSQGYFQHVGNLKRITSIASEPPVFGFIMTAFIPLIVARYFKAKEEGDNHPKLYLILVILSIICGILTTSSTFYLGFSILVFIYFLLKLLKKDENKVEKFKGISKDVLLLVTCAILSFGLLTLPNYLKIERQEKESNDIELVNEEKKEIIEQKKTKEVKDTVNTLMELTIHKLKSGSGIERIGQEKEAIKYFKLSPIIGIGYGTISTYIVFTNILINMGILGFIIFIFIIVYCVLGIIKNRKKDILSALGLLFSILGMLIAFSSSVADITYLFFWGILILGYKYFVSEENDMQKSTTLYINGRFLSQNITGTQRAAREIIKQIDSMNLKDVVLLIPKKLENFNENYKNIKIKRIGLLKGQLWEQISLPFYLKGEDALLNLCNIAPIIHPGYILIQDISFKTHKDYFNWKFSLWYRFVTKININRYKKIFTGSEFSKNEIINTYKIKNEKIIVCYNAATKLSDNYDEEILEKLKLKKQEYYFSIGSNSKNKNRDYILECASKNPKEIFVITGKTIDIASNKETEETPNNVILTGYLTDSEIATLYKNCKGFIFPSIYEGFGLPPLEAMIYGCKRIYVSNIEVLKEIYKNSVNYIDLNSSKRYKLNGKTKEKEIEAILKQYSWDKTTKSILDEIMKNMNC